MSAKFDSVLLLSGGLDSLVLLARERAEGRNPLCLSVGYGQRHRREMNAAALIADRYGVRRLRLDLPDGVFGPSALTGGVETPLDLDPSDPAQVATIVPGRNLLLISLAGAVAAECGAGAVLIGCHAGDAAVYPDCRPDFLAGAGRALFLGCGVELHAPFACLNKRGVVALGRQLGAPLELAWSCYLGGDDPCGRCGACIARSEAGG